MSTTKTTQMKLLPLGELPPGEVEPQPAAPVEEPPRVTVGGPVDRVGAMGSVPTVDALAPPRTESSPWPVAPEGSAAAGPGGGGQLVQTPAMPQTAEEFAKVADLAPGIVSIAPLLEAPVEAPVEAPGRAAPPPWVPPAITAPCPFVPPLSTPTRCKVFLFGDTGTKKTVTSLQFPGAAVIDMERGTTLYGDTFKFHRLTVTDADSVIAAVRWLLTEPHEFRTLIIDPITVFWEALQRKWSDIFLSRKEGGKGHRGEFYEFQMQDWSTLKSDWKQFLRLLLALDMNVIVTAHEKAVYSGQTIVGHSFDAEKKALYMFDVVLRLTRETNADGGEDFTAHRIKDRTGCFPATFPTTYEAFQEAFGVDVLERPPTPADLARDEQCKRFEQLVAELKLPPAMVSEALRRKGAEEFSELRREAAQAILETLEAKLPAAAK